ncbi:dihydroxyacetone kinase [Fusarium denticulatum]|uniref:Dihydroxyacetone kinase n=1 Tax=Fusarium denticulatum TaxID=48507 RepID=A0A8H5WRH0_9HYPO|nr:dihydroxyacetone kinase [Fusarium denticulatum]
MSDRHFFDNAAQLVAYAIDYKPLTAPSLKVDLVDKIVYRKNVNGDHVAVMSGDFLTVSVAGTIFAFPSTAAQILNALVRCSKASKGAKEADIAQLVGKMLVFFGTCMTSHNGIGFSIILKPATAMFYWSSMTYQLIVGWSALIRPDARRTAGATVLNNHMRDEEKPKMRKLTEIQNGADVGTYDAVLSTNAFVNGLRMLTKAETKITWYDITSGNGDHWVSLKAILHHVLDQLLVGRAVFDLASIFPVIETSLDGTSEALYAVFLNALRPTLHHGAAPCLLVFVNGQIS